MSTLAFQLINFEGIQEVEELDPKLHRIWKGVKKGSNLEFSLSTDGVLNFKGRLCVPNDEELQTQILMETHTTPYSIHPGAMKMYKDLKESFWWPSMKGDMVKFFEKCMVCQKIKAEHQ